jgi:hypothetical protein
VSVKSIYEWAAEDATMPQLRLGTGKGGTLRFPRERVMRWLRQRESQLAERPSRKQMPHRREATDSIDVTSERNGG